jgi:hypothetical protein
MWYCLGLQTAEHSWIDTLSDTQATIIFEKNHEQSRTWESKASFTPKPYSQLLTVLLNRRTGALKILGSYSHQQDEHINLTISMSFYQSPKWEHSEEWNKTKYNNITAGLTFFDFNWYLIICQNGFTRPITTGLRGFVSTYYICRHPAQKVPDEDR